MTIGTMTFFAITGAMLSLKLVIMVLAVVLLMKALSPARNAVKALPVVAMTARNSDVRH